MKIKVFIRETILRVKEHSLISRNKSIYLTKYWKCLLKTFCIFYFFSSFNSQIKNSSIYNMKISVINLIGNAAIRIK